MFVKSDAPYLTPSPTLLQAQEWHIEEDNEQRLLDDYVSSWAQGTDIYLSRTIEIDRAQILEESHLPADAKLGIAVSWMSNATQIKRLIYRSEIDDKPLHVRVCISGDQVSGTIKLRSTLLLLSKYEESKSWTASEPGAILLQEKVQVAFEGNGSVFPMAVIDFVSSSYPNEASWYLVTSTQLDSRFSSTFQVMISEQDQKLVKAIEAAKPTKEQTALIDEMMLGVLSTVLELAYSLRSEGQLSLDGYEDGSVGAVLAGFVETTGDLALVVESGPASISHRRAFFDSLARSIGAGRSFS